MIKVSTHLKQPQSNYLVDELERVKGINSLISPTHEFWLGYISAFTCPVDNCSKQILNLNDWTLLSELIKNIVNLAHDQIIKKDNVIELITYSLHCQIKKQTPSGINIKEIYENIRTNLNQVVLSPNFLLSKYFSQQNTKLNSQQSQNKQLLFMQEDASQESDNKSGLGIECPICLSQITLNEVCPVSCQHLLHKSCFVQYFKQKIQNKKFPINCPYDNCQVQICTQDIQQYIPKNIKDKFYEFSLHEFIDKNSKNTRWCPTAGCPAVFSYDIYNHNYKCVSCKKEYCLSCLTQSHESLTCQENKTLLNIPQDEKAFIKFANGTNMKQCPNCKFWIEKNEGCDHMTCRCSYQFCFKCGAKYGVCQCHLSEQYYGRNSDIDDLDYQEQRLTHDDYYVQRIIDDRMSRLEQNRLRRYRMPPNEEEENESFPLSLINGMIKVFSKDKNESKKKCQKNEQIIQEEKTEMELLRQ